MKEESSSAGAREQAEAMRAAARAEPQGIHVELTNGQWFRSSNNDFKPQAVWNLDEARCVRTWLDIVLPAPSPEPPDKRDRVVPREVTLANCPNCGEPRFIANVGCIRCHYRPPVGSIPEPSADYIATVRSLIAAYDSNAIDTRHCIDSIRKTCSEYLRGKSPSEPSRTTDSVVLGFIGYLSGAVPELHKVEVPVLATHWENYKWTCNYRFSHEPGANHE